MRASKQSDRQTRAQRAHWRLSWDERLARNTRGMSVPPLAITLHGLPATFSQFFGFALVAAVQNTARLFVPDTLSLLLFFLSIFFYAIRFFAPIFFF